MDLGERWSALVAGSGEPRLAEAAALVAAHRHRELDPDAVLGRLDEMAATCADASVHGLRAHLFGVLGFTGDTDEYHHERNSMLPAVLERRRGLPILLSIVAIDVGRQLGLAVQPIGLPGHFLVGIGVGDDWSARPLYLDPFAGGAILDRDGAAALVRRSQGTVVFDDRWLVPTPTLDVVARLLANLRHTYASAGDRENLRWVLELRLTLPGVDRAEAFDLAEILARGGEVDRAAHVLDALATTEVDGPAAAEARRRAVVLRASLN